jgi:hypothetical protein
LADALGSGPSGLRPVRVRVPPSAHKKASMIIEAFLFIFNEVWDFKIYTIILGLSFTVEEVKNVDL